MINRRVHRRCKSRLFTPVDYQSRNTSNLPNLVHYINRVIDRVPSRV